MSFPLHLLAILAAFGLVALASRQIGHFAARFHLPLITGFLLTGILAGPYVLGLIPASALGSLRFADEVALAFIAFAAGAELNLQEMRGRLRSIRAVTLGLVLSTFTLVSLTLYLISDAVPFMREMPAGARLAVSVLAGAVMVARSPSSAIAVVNELRARGPFTRMVLGVTVIMDVVVITLFAVNSSIADALISDLGLNLRVVALVVAEVIASIALGVALGKLLPVVATRRARMVPRAILLLALGWGVFTLSGSIRALTQEAWTFVVLLEPLLICMVAGFTVTNFTDHRIEFQRVLDSTGPPIYIVFFTLAGASLALDVLADTWGVALLIFAVRLGAIFIGSMAGGIAAGDPMRLNRVAWMAFVTQAGIGLGLAKEVAVEFPAWGNSLATMVISVIVLNQVVGPPLFKWVLHAVGESRVRAGRRDLRGTPLAMIFGLEGQTLALARQLDHHGWQVKVVTRKTGPLEEPPEPDIEILRIASLDPDELKAIGAGEAVAFVGLMSDDENQRLCELAYEHFGTRRVIVRSYDRSQWNGYRELGATILDPAVAMVSLLDHFVRSPSAASLLLGMERNQDVADLEVRNADLHGLRLRDLKLPLDTLVLSVKRNGASLISHGYTRLELGDRLTVVGSLSSLDEVALKFGE